MLNCLSRRGGGQLQHTPGMGRGGRHLLHGLPFGRPRGCQLQQACEQPKQPEGQGGGGPSAGIAQRLPHALTCLGQRAPEVWEGWAGQRHSPGRRSAVSSPAREEDNVVLTSFKDGVHEGDMQQDE